MVNGPAVQETSLTAQQRLLLAVVALVAVGTTLYNWYVLGLEHSYYSKLAFFAPCFAVIFGAVSIRPSLAGTGTPTDQSKKYRQGALLLAGAAVGLINWYAMARS